MRSQGPERGEVSRPSYPRGLGAGLRSGSVSPPAPLPAPGTQETPDFSQIDFDRLWAGRRKVTEVEGALLLLALAQEPPGRGLEIGAGGGRLTPYLARWSKDLVASDATLSLLRGRPSPQGPDVPRVGANVYHLPFADDVFAVATLVRVLGFLTDPGAALREIHRVLRPGGILVLSFEPHPSVSTLLDDLKVAFAPTRVGPVRPMTFSRGNVVPVRPSAYPAWSHTRGSVRAIAGAAGFSIEAEYPSGLEDLALLRRLPVSTFVSLARAGSRLGGFPTRFARLRKVSPAGEVRPQGPPKSRP